MDFTTCFNFQAFQENSILPLTTVVVSVSSEIFGIILVFWSFSPCFLALLLLG